MSENNDSYVPVTIKINADGKVIFAGLTESPMEGTIEGKTITIPYPDDPEQALIVIENVDTLREVNRESQASK